MSQISDYLKEVGVRGSKKTVADYSARLARFQQWQSECKNWQLTKKNVRDFLVHLQETKTGAASIALHKATLSSYFSWLVENEVMEENPIIDLKFGAYHSSKKGHECMFTAEEYAALKAHTAGHSYWHGALIIGWNTALRLGDVARLHWDMVGLEEKRIDLTPSKTKRFKKSVEIPILPELLAFLEARPHRMGFIQPGMQREYAENGAKQLSQQFLRICQAVGIEGKSFHGLRHTCASRMLNKGLPANIVGSITGHNLTSLQKYAHASFTDVSSMVQEAMT